MESIRFKRNVKLIAPLITALMTFVLCFWMSCDTAHASSGPGNPHWDKTTAVWNAETFTDDDTIYHFRLYKKSNGQNIEVANQTLTNTTEINVYEYVKNDEGETFFFTVTCARPGNAESNASTSPTAVFYRVTLKDTVNPLINRWVVGRMGDYLEFPDAPEVPGGDQSYKFLGWARDEDGSQMWDFRTDKLEGSGLTLYAKWTNEAHVHDGIEFEPWPHTGTLPKSGNYYLVYDIYPSSPGEPDGTLNLCLNGKTVHGQGGCRTFDIKDGADVTIWNDTGEGTLAGGTWMTLYEGGTVLIEGGKLTLNSGTLSGGNAHTSGGNVLMTRGEFVMNGGLITGGSAFRYGAGVCVSGGTFTMNGGSISGNVARTGGVMTGGGVYVGPDGTFFMRGGSITRNYAYYGGGVSAAFQGGTFKISGGSITNNSSEYAGGVYIANHESITIAAGSDGTHTDQIIIKNNVDSSASDIMKDFNAISDGTVPYIKVEAIISDDSEIGVHTSKAPGWDDYPDCQPVTSGLYESGNRDASAFFADEYAVLDKDDEAWLIARCGEAGHKYTLSKKSEAIDPTCEDYGSIEYWVCDKGSDPCGKAYKDEAGTEEVYERRLVDEGGTLIPPLGHEPGEATRENEVAATCTTDGSYDSVVYCTREGCGEEISRTHETIEAAGHSWGDWQEWTTGSTIHKKRTCTVCDETEEYTEDSEHVHNVALNYSPGTPATCIADGIKEHFECTCGYWFEVGSDGAPTGDPKTSDAFVIEATGHSGGDPVKENADPATCEENGSYDSVVYCTVCGVEISRTRCVEEALGHDYQEDETTAVEPTCTEEGKAAGQKCTRCGSVIEGAAVPATGHDWNDGEVIVEPTESDEGVKMFTCSKCGGIKTEVIPKLQISIQGATVVLSSSAFTYNKKVQKPTVKTVGGKTLKSGTDYTIKYSNASSKNVGSYTVTITGKGDYTGTTKATYKINPKGATIRAPKKAKKAITVRWKKQTLKMASSRITGYQIQLATDKNFTQNKKTVTVKGYKKVSRKVKGLKKKTKYFVRVRTYKTVSGTKYYSPWSKTKSVKTK